MWTHILFNLISYAKNIQGNIFICFMIFLMKNSKIQILLSAVMLFALVWCSSQWQEIQQDVIDYNQNDVVINENVIEDEKEYDFPKLNWWNIQDFGQWWNTLFIELENEYDDPIDVAFNVEYFDANWNSLWTGQDLLVIGIMPHTKRVGFDNRNIPNAVDLRPVSVSVSKSIYMPVEYEIIKNEYSEYKNIRRIWNSVDIDFDIEWELYDANIFVIFYNWDKVVGWDLYSFSDPQDSYHRYEWVDDSFDHYEIYVDMVNY